VKSVARKIFWTKIHSLKAALSAKSSLFRSLDIIKKHNLTQLHKFLKITPSNTLEMNA